MTKSILVELVLLTHFEPSRVDYCQGVELILHYSIYLTGRLVLTRTGVYYRTRRDPFILREAHLIRKNAVEVKVAGGLSTEKTEIIAPGILNLLERRTSQCMLSSTPGADAIRLVALQLWHIREEQYSSPGLYDAKKRI